MDMIHIGIRCLLIYGLVAILIQSCICGMFDYTIKRDFRMYVYGSLLWPIMVLVMIILILHVLSWFMWYWIIFPTIDRLFQLNKSYLKFRKLTNPFL